MYESGRNVKTQNSKLRREKAKSPDKTLPQSQVSTQWSENGRWIAGIAEAIRVRAAGKIEYQIVRSKRRRISPKASGAPHHRLRASPHRLRQRIHHSRKAFSLFVLHEIRNELFEEFPFFLLFFNDMLVYGKLYTKKKTRILTITIGSDREEFTVKFV